MRRKQYIYLIIRHFLCKYLLTSQFDAENGELSIVVYILLRYKETKYLFLLISEIIRHFLCKYVLTSQFDAENDMLHMLG
jgi:hypothetical protein